MKPHHIDRETLDRLAADPLDPSVLDRDRLDPSMLDRDLLDESDLKPLGPIEWTPLEPLPPLDLPPLGPLDWEPLKPLGWEPLKPLDWTPMPLEPLDGGQLGDDGLSGARAGKRTGNAEHEASVHAGDVRTASFGNEEVREYSCDVATSGSGE